MEWFNNFKVWKFNRNGVLEDVKLERWVWGVVYKDGTELHQFDNQGIFHQMGEINQEQVHLFSVYKPFEPSKRIDLVVTGGMKLIYKYKMVQPFYMDHFVRVFCFGYKKNNKHHFNFILPDDRLVVSDIENVDLPNFELDRK